MKEHADLLEALARNSALVEAALVEVSDKHDADTELIFEAQRYSLLGGGKRIRPFIVNTVCGMLGGSLEASMPLAVAVEMIHTYSLIHDDLPCMDDDDMRRGKPTNHRVFGYANALLAGDALLTGAFGVIADAEHLDVGVKAKAISILSRAAGDCGMIGGQVLDLEGETRSLDFDTLLKLHSMKTGALIRCSAMLGCLAAGFMPDSDEAIRINTYADRIGLAFQVVDDVLDLCADETELGKSVGSDADHNKTTFITYYDIGEAREYARRLTEEAIAAVSGMNGSDMLCELAAYLLDRTK